MSTATWRVVVTSHSDSGDVVDFFFNDTATTEIYTLSLHDALPIFIVFDTLTLADDRLEAFYDNPNALRDYFHKTPLIGRQPTDRKSGSAGMPRPISYAVFCLKKKKTRLGTRLLLRITQIHESYG